MLYQKIFLFLFDIQKCYAEKLHKFKYWEIKFYVDRLCGLVVRVPGCRPTGPGFDSRSYQIFCIAVGLERCALSLVRINVELLERKVAAPV
jgi:hypothetical protein